jgi:periplasmic divalent cation tolerance protein
MSEARRIGRALVEERLAACCNLVAGLRSIYRWKGKVCDDPEVLMVIKTTADCFEALAERVTELHSYDVPEVVSMPITEGSEAYVKWLQRQCRLPDDGR